MKFEDDEEEYVPQAEPEKPVEAKKEEKKEESETQASSDSNQKPAAAVEKTEAEKKLQEETEKAKIQLIKEIEGIKAGDNDQSDEPLEEESELSHKFTVTNP